jgi:hypothetical protein
MGVNLSIKNVPESLAEKLRQRAEANHRSLQGELMAMLHEALPQPGAEQTRRPYVVGPVETRSPDTASALRAFQESFCLSSAHVDDTVRLIRDMREERTDHLMRLVESARARKLLGLPVPPTKPIAPAAQPESKKRRAAHRAGKAA